MNLRDEAPVDSVYSCWKVQMDIDALAIVAEPASASGAYPVEDNSSIDLPDMLVKNLVPVSCSYMLKNLYRPFPFAACFEAFLSVHSSQK